MVTVAAFVKTRALLSAIVPPFSTIHVPPVSVLLP